MDEERNSRRRARFLSDQRGIGRDAKKYSEREREGGRNSYLSKTVEEDESSPRKTIAQAGELSLFHFY